MRAGSLPSPSCALHQQARGRRASPRAPARARRPRRAAPTASRRRASRRARAGSGARARPRRSARRPAASRYSTAGWRRPARAAPRTRRASTPARVPPCRRRRRLRGDRVIPVRGRGTLRPAGSREVVAYGHGSGGLGGRAATGPPARERADILLHVRACGKAARPRRRRNRYRAARPGDGARVSRSRPSRPAGSPPPRLVRIGNAA